jgi:hypothetical protein
MRVLPYQYVDLHTLALDIIALTMMLEMVISAQEIMPRYRKIYNCRIVQFFYCVRASFRVSHRALEFAS